jgi:spore germination protein KC
MPLSAFYGHDNIFILGGKATKENIKELTELCLRYPETRPRAFILVTKGEAFSVLQAESLVNSTISQEIKRLVEDKAERSGIAYGVPFYEFTDWLLSSDRDVVLPQIKLFYPEKGEKTVQKSVIVEGFGVFRGEKLAGWLDEDESKGYMFITQKINRAQIAIPVSKDGKMFTYWLTNSKSKIEVRMTGDKPSFLIKIEAQGGVYENNGLELTPEGIKALEEVSGEKIQELTLQTITKAKEYDSDFLGIMEKLHRYNPGAWKKVAPNWRESFSKADVDVEVEAKIVSVGKLAKNLLIKQ